ncbi:dihydrofolate reductase family protein [Pontibacter mangrovi]|uniref:Dihydrofolate reductase n=1 Tax=Pontibacter mangrovi TaxID=2589816 RepID=A0A501WCE1_9BACT|nr:dihydrofolate reductase family protein [Pontibacter mangrovi]TPE44891.1 dihydrofolate reductase [Pontibacter mangrovi]
MREVILYIAVSLDGYIARTDGSTDWLEAPAFTLQDEDFGYSTFLQSIDTTLMGYNTYQTILNFAGPFPYSGKTNYVFSRSPEADTAQVSFIPQEEATAFVKRLKQQSGQAIWLIGGGKLNTMLLRTNLIDEIILTTVPVILGAGVPLFATGAPERQLEVRESKTYPIGFVQLRLKP